MKRSRAPSPNYLRAFTMASLATAALADLFGGPFQQLLNYLLAVLLSFCALAVVLLGACFAMGVLGGCPRQ
jgi:hypothetical protein